MQIITIIIVIALIGLIGWWFFGKRNEDQAKAQMDDGIQTIKVDVNGGYSPSQIVLKQGVPANLIFNRQDASSCLERVVFEKQGINEFLPQGEDHLIKIDTSKAGEYDFACGMNMFHGKVVVE